MAITVEDGTVVTTANSYISLADFITYAAEVGVTVANEAASEVYLVKAFKFIDTMEPRLKGYRRYVKDSNAFPRDGLVVDGYTYDNDEIPQVVIDCQCELALDLVAGVDLYNRKQSDSAPVRSVRVEGAVSKEYAVGVAPAQMRKSLSRSLLRKLLKSSGPTVSAVLA